MKLLYLHLVSITRQKANIIQVAHMCNAFQKIGIETTLALPIDTSDKINLNSIIKDKIGFDPAFKIITIPELKFFNRSFEIVSAFQLFIKFFNKKKTYDYCFTRCIWSNYFALKLFKNVIFESHESTIKPNSTLMNHLCIKLLIKNSFKSNQVLFISISNALKQFWLNLGIPSKKLIAKHDGVLETDYNNIDINGARLHLKINTKKKVATYAGSLYKDRGIDIILDLAMNFPKIHFIVVGGPEDQKQLYENQCFNLNIKNISFTGNIPHHKVKFFLAASDILLLMYTNNVPTINICSPLKLFEYMASKKIIVGHSFPTIKEVLKDGKNALLASPNNFDELKNKLELAASLNYPNRLSNNAKNDVIKYFTWEKRAKDIFRKLNPNYFKSK